LFQKQNTIPEAIALDFHDKVDGIKIFFASEAPGQVRGWIDSGLKFIAQRA
jgi:hypothetical protein